MVNKYKLIIIKRHFAPPPWLKKIQFQAETQKTDYSLLAYDCFHMSQKGNA